MRFIQHPSNNGVLDPPKGLSNEECRPLPVTRVVYTESRILAIRSYWKPDEEELKKLMSGAPIMLEILTPSTHPPVNVSVGDWNGY